MTSRNPMNGNEERREKIQKIHDASAVVARSEHCGRPDRHMSPWYRCTPRWNNSEKRGVKNEGRSNEKRQKRVFTSFDFFSLLLEGRRSRFGLFPRGCASCTCRVFSSDFLKSFFFFFKTSLFLLLLDVLDVHTRSLIR